MGRTTDQPTTLLLCWFFHFISQQVGCQINEKQNQYACTSSNCSCCIGNVTCPSDSQCGGQCKDGYFGGRCFSSCPVNCISCKDPYNPTGTRSLWAVANCTQCKDGHYSTSQFFQCQFDCPTGCHTCNSDTDCTSCKDGYTLEGTTCRQCKTGCASCQSYDYCTQCDDGYYNSGDTAYNLNCVACSKGCSNQCDKAFGNCTCKSPDFTGIRCDICIDGMTGANCNFPCQTGCNICARNSGSDCASCINGYYLQGNTCHQCKPGCAGCSSYNDCTSCIHGYYQHENTCHKCKPGCSQCFFFNDCILCMNGFYTFGTDCVACSKGCANHCDKGTGYCSCKTGFDGEKCENCSSNFQGTRCDQCIQTFHGTSCDETCPTHCKDNACSRHEGLCNEGCIENFIGIKCTDCVEGRYGEDCSLQCPENCIGACNRSTGFCQLCKTSYVGNICEECSAGKHGSDCSLECPSGCKANNCDRVTGTCNRCLDGMYGSQCNLTCPSECVNKTCVRTTGACSDGCTSGYSGDMCCLNGSNCKSCSSASHCSDCLSNRYGDTCDNECPANCADSLCDKNSGTCNRCIDGFQGDFCTEYMEVKDIFPLASVIGSIAGGIVVFTIAVLLLACFRRRAKRNTSDRHVVAFTNERVYENEPDSTSAEENKIESQYVSMETLQYPLVSTPTEESKGENQYVSIETLQSPLVSTSTKMWRKRNKDVPVNASLPDKDDDGQQWSRSEQVIYSQPNKVSRRGGTAVPVPSTSTAPALSGNIEETENDYYNNCDSSTGLDVNDLASFFEQKAGFFFKSEFQMLPRGLTKPTKEAKKDQNVGKNRFNAILPYDETRVILHGPGSDFINASYIEGFHRRREYIASFGPISKATEGFRTFWRMVWQEQTEKIVMVTNLTESSGMKCEKYWPDVNKTQQYGDVRVTCHSEDVYAEYTIRSFTAKKGKQQRSLQHIHYTTWPDKGVPDNVTSLIEFRNKVNSTKVTLGGPVIVHCSAGVGRTGTYIALDILTYKGKRIGKVDIFDCVEKLRQQRTGMVQTPDQYEYIYRALVHTLTLGSEAIRAETFRSYLSSVTEHDMKTKFEMMCHIKEKISAEEREAVVKITREFKHLNRDGADIPGDSNRLQLFLGITAGDNNYINAVYVDSFKLKNQFIVTQTPLPTTVNDFLTLVVQTNCACIVSMDPIDVANKDIGTYLPADNQVLRSESFEVTSTKLKSNNSYSLRRLVIKAKLMSNFTTCTVHHFQCTNWPGTSTRPTSTESVLQLVNEVVTTAEESMSSSPIIVHCVTGSERSGLLCAVVNLLQKMEIEHEVSVINTIRQVKVRRPKAIPNKEQFMFCHECVAAYLQTFDIYSNFS